MALPRIDVMGPAQAPLARIRRSYRWQVVLKTPSSRHLNVLAQHGHARIRPKSPRRSDPGRGYRSCFHVVDITSFQPGAGRPGHGNPTCILRFQRGAAAVVSDTGEDGWPRIFHAFASRQIARKTHCRLRDGRPAQARRRASLLVPVYARLLSPSENGDMALAYAFVSFSVLLYALGLNHALVRHLSVERGVRRHSPQVQHGHIGHFWSSASCFLSSYGLPRHPSLFFFLNSTSYADIFRIIAVILLLDTLSEPFFTLCRVRQRSGIYAAVRFIQHTLQLGLTVYLIAWEGHGWYVHIFWSNLASSTFAFLALCPVGFRKLRPVYSPAILRELLHFGLPFVPSAAALLLINLSDRFASESFHWQGPRRGSFRSSSVFVCPCRCLRAYSAPRGRPGSWPFRTERRPATSSPG